MSVKGYTVLCRILAGPALSFAFVSELVEKALHVPKMALAPLTEGTCSALDKSVRAGSGRASWQ